MKKERLFVLEHLPPIQPHQRRPAKFNAKGKFYSSQALLDAIHEMFNRGNSIIEISDACGVNYRTVRKALALRPNQVEPAAASPTEDERYVIVSETGIADVDAAKLYQEMDQPWVQGAALADSTPIRIRRRISAMGANFGWVRVAKLVYVDPITFKAPLKS